MPLDQKETLTLTLPEGTCLNQYRIGSVLSYNGESTVYQAEAEGSTWWIREFLPRTMVTRQPETLELLPTTEAQTIYKYSLAAFEELFRVLYHAGEQKLEYILPIKELIHANQTLYVVQKAMHLPTLEQYAKEKGLPFTWTEVKKALLPLMNSVAQLHGKGVVHLGIAPENLYVTEDGHVILAHFSTLEARTADGELDQELYAGFTSPEQYAGGEWKGGPWSDVYALGAVCYWLLSGQIPPSAQQRVESDTLLPLMESNPAVAESVSDAVSAALMLDPGLRSACVDEFASALLESVSGNTTIYEVPDIQPNENTVHLEQQMVKKPLWPRLLLGFLLFLLLVSGLTFGAYRLVTERVFEQNQQEENTISEEESVLYSVPDFVGHKYNDILNHGSYFKDFHITTVEEYNDSYPAGVIVAQSVAKGSQVASNSSIVLTVSKGKETVTLPSLMGLSLQTAKQKLEEAGISYTVYVVENHSYTANTVFRTDPAEGTEIARTDGTVVKIYVTPEQSETENKKPSSKKEKSEKE